jgi:hypothetical protein
MKHARYTMLVAILMVTVGMPTSASSQLSGQAGDLLAKQRVLGDFGNWWVSTGQTVDGSKYRGLNDVEAKRIILADLAPLFVARASGSLIQATVWVGTQPAFPVPLTLIRTGRSLDHWWLTKLEPIEAFDRLASWLVDNSEMKFAFPNTDTPDITVSMSGFPAALAAMKACGG